MCQWMNLELQEVRHATRNNPIYAFKVLRRVDGVYQSPWWDCDWTHDELRLGRQKLQMVVPVHPHSDEGWRRTTNGIYAFKDVRDARTYRLNLVHDLGGKLGVSFHVVRLGLFGKVACYGPLKAGYRATSAFIVEKLSSTINS